MQITFITRGSIVFFDGVLSREMRERTCSSRRHSEDVEALVSSADSLGSRWKVSSWFRLQP